MGDIEYRAADLDVDGREVGGWLVRYGSTATLGRFTETIAPGAIQVPGDLILNRQHDRKKPLARTGGGLVLTPTEKGVELRATLPNTRDADDTLELIRAKVLRGLSAEFKAIRDRWQGNHRTVTQAVLTGAAIVDKGAYADATIAVRHLEERAAAVLVGGGLRRLSRY